uniref:Uncharacterized protein n=1 Tax=Trieres chinensis TaxID=1514140 RepID=A0A7S1Z435_TRICV
MIACPTPHFFAAFDRLDVPAPVFDARDDFDPPPALAARRDEPPAALAPERDVLDPVLGTPAAPARDDLGDALGMPPAAPAREEPPDFVTAVDRDVLLTTGAARLARLLLSSEAGRGVNLGF